MDQPLHSPSIHESSLLGSDILKDFIQPKSLTRASTLSLYSSHSLDKLKSEKSLKSCTLISAFESNLSMAKKKKVNRPVATVSSAKKQIVVAETDESVEETEAHQAVSVQDPIVQDLNAQELKAKDADRLLKWQVEYDFKTQDQKRIKLESNMMLPELEVPSNEKEICELLRDYQEETLKVSTDELEKTFLMMEKLGFARNIIKDSLKNSAGDLNSAIGWIYLNSNLVNDDLPAFSKETVKMDSEVSSRGNDDLESQFVKSKESRNDAELESAEFKKLSIVEEAPKGGIDKDLQNRILASLEWLDSDGSDDLEKEDLNNRQNVINEYASMYINHLQFRKNASEAKFKGDSAKNKSFSNSAHKLMQKIIQLKCKMDGDQLKSAEEIVQEWTLKALAESPMPQGRDQSLDSHSEDEGELGLQLFEEMNTDDGVTSKTIFIHDLYWKAWSGSSPSFWLSDFVKRKSSTGKVSYSFFPKTTAYRAKLSLKLNDIKEYAMDEDELVKSKNDAKEYIALKTLFTLAPESQIRNSIAPPFRDLWEKWNEAAARGLEEEIRALDDDRIKFIQDLNLENPISNSKYFSAFEKKGKSNQIAPKSGYTSGLRGVKSRFESQLFQKYSAVRASLPIFLSRQKIIDQIRESQIVIISGETGSGKSTQIPQYILEDSIERSDKSFLKIYCCEPRRISAISLATRVSLECGDGNDQVGKPGSLIGYQVRMDNRTASSNLVTFCTLGILLRRLVGDPYLSGVSHVIVDEVHERSVESDFLLLLLKRLILVRRDLKLILMSATADIQKYQAYFRQDTTDPVCLVFPGKIFPVQEFYLEDIIKQIGWEPEILENNNYVSKTSQKINISSKGGKKISVHAEWSNEDLDTKDFTDETSSKVKDLEIRNRKIDMEFLESLITYTVKYSLENSLGAILVFLPGVGEINDLQDRLDALSSGKSQLPCVTFPLYSDLPNIEQLKVFDPVHDSLVKVVLSTNIAETGLTVPDVTFVIDTAKARELSYDPTLNLTALREIVVSKSNCLQRKGRAGRTQSGVYYNILTKSAFDSLPSHRPPELMRLPLEGICLKARAILGNEAGSLIELFSESLDPPPAKNIEKAVSLLQQLQAMKKSEELTPLGIHLSKLGMDVKLGKMLIYSIIFKCLDPILTISACLSTGKRLFLPHFGESADFKRSLKKFYNSDSDLLMMYSAYLKCKDLRAKNPSKAAIKAYCRENYLNLSVLSSLDSTKSQIMRSLLDTGILDRNQKIIFGESIYDSESSSVNITRTILSVAFFPNIVHAQKQSDRIGANLYRFGDCRPVMIHQNSLLSDNVAYNSWYGSNSMKVSNRKIIALDLNLISPIGMLCLVANDIEINIIQQCFTVFNGTITIKASPKALILISKLSKLIQKAVDYSLESSNNQYTKDSLEIIQKFTSLL